MSAALYRVVVDALASGCRTRREVVEHIARVGVVVDHEDVRRELRRAEEAGCVRREGGGRGTAWVLA